MKKSSALRRLGSALKILLAVYLALVVLTALLPYWFPPKIPPEQQAAFDPAAFYGDAPTADRVALVESPADGLAVRLQLLAEAKERLDIAYYGMPMGNTTDQFLAGVLAAADRGVQVRLLVDGVSGGLTYTHPDYARALGAHPNIELRLYNPPNPLCPWTINGRMHDKYMLVDGRLMILGGRNIGDRYFDDPAWTGPVSLDREVLVYNTAWRPGQAPAPESAPGQVRAYMDSLWNSDSVRQPFERDSAGGKKCRAKLTALAETLPEAAPVDWQAATLPAAKITLLHNGGDPGPKAPAVGYALSRLVTSAQESVVLQSPYAVPDPLLDEMLAQLGGMDIDCTLLTNSLAASPNLPACSCYQRARKGLASGGIRVMEYQTPECLHAKSYLIDGRLSLVGSFNLDPRSAVIDTELLLAIDSPEFARVLQTTLDGYLQNALQVAPDGSYLPGAAAPAETGFFKRAASAVLGVVLLPFRCLV